MKLDRHDGKKGSGISEESSTKQTGKAAGIQRDSGDFYDYGAAAIMF